MLRAWPCAGLLTVFTTFVAQSQEVRGSVRDSASRQPIAGAVLILVDSSGAALGRNITDERGQYRMVLSSGVQRIRVLRIGFRQRELALPMPMSGVSRLDVMMVAIPMLLDAVRVTANPACPRRRDDAAAFALLEQARSGALATLVAREAKPPALVRYTFERTMDGTSDRARMMTVRKDSVGRTITSFSAVHSAADFIRRGFMDDAGDQQTFYAPDAEVLLDEGFANGYCFRIVRSEHERADQVGLGFVAADRKRGRVDVDGILWIDTVARALRDMEFRYAGLDSRVERYRPGGTISFREMPNGAVLIDRWTLHLIGASYDSSQAPHVEGIERRQLRGQTTLESGRVRFFANESGGELAHARWSEETAWDARLGTLSARVLRQDGQPAVGVITSLRGTPYQAVSDSAGRITLRDLVPGPYSVSVIDSLLSPIDLIIPTTANFVAARDSTFETSFVAQNADEYVVGRCAEYGQYAYAAADSTRVIARMMDGGSPIENVRWQARVSTAPSEATSLAGDSWVTIPQHGTTGTDGLLQICSPLLSRNRTIEIEAWRDGTRTRLRRRLSDQLTVIRIPFEPRH